MIGLVRQRKNNMIGQFRSSVWDPVLIICQIVCLQCSFYVSAGMWICLVSLIGGCDRSLHTLLPSGSMDVRESTGRIITAIFCLNSLTSALALSFIVKRTKQCLDFAATVFLMHILACCFYQGHIPNNVSWWLINIICLTITTVLGEFLCMKTEMQAIPLSGASKADL